MPGEFATILIAIGTGAVVALALLLWADAQDTRRMNERLRHQRALVEEGMSYGDWPHLPTIEQPRGE